VKWQAWESLLDLLTLFQQHKELIIGKARQNGISWLVCGYCLWLCLFNENVKVLFLSQGESEAWDLVAKCRFIWNHLPDFLKEPIGHTSKGFLDFPGNGSEIRAYPSTEKAGRSTDASIVIRDELEFHPYGAANFSAIGPTIDAGGAQLIELSTRDKLKKDSHFMKRFRSALGGGSSYPVFLGWRARPNREEGMTQDEWFQKRIKSKYSEIQVEQEYPETLDEFLGEVVSSAFFDITALNHMLSDLKKPIDHELGRKYPLVMVYQDRVVGERYCCFTDPSDGKDDPHALGVMKIKTGTVVAISHGKIPADEVAKIHDAVCRYYNNAYNTFEANASAGGKMAATIVNLGTPNMHIQKKDRVGWFTSNISKRDTYYGLEEAIRLYQISIPNREAIEELRSVYQVKSKSGKLKFHSEGHNDFVIMLAGLWAISKVMPRGGVKSFSFHYKESQ